MGGFVGGRIETGTQNVLRAEYLSDVGGLMRMSLTDRDTSLGSAPTMCANLVASAVIFFRAKICSACTNQMSGSTSQKGHSLAPAVDRESEESSTSDMTE